MSATPLETKDPANPNRDSLPALFEALESPLLAYAMKLTQQMEAAQDIVQEAFVRLQAQKKRVEAPKPWLYRTAHNLAADYHRARRKIVPLAADGEGGALPETPDAAPTPEEAAQRWEAVARARECVHGLDARSQRLLRLKFEEGLSYREISAETGLSVSNVGYVLHHALKEVGALLRKAGIDS